MVSNLIALTLALTAGGLLGAFFFGSLWWTVRKGLASEQPAYWFLGGMILRISLTLAAFYYTCGEDWRRWSLCLVGFVLARHLVSRLIRMPAEPQKFQPPAISYAP